MKIMIDRKATQLPLNLISGNKTVRLQKAEQYTKDFFQMLTEKSNGDDVSLRDFQSILRKTSGKNIKIDIMKGTEQPYSIATGPTINENGKIVGYTMFLPQNIKNKISMLKSRIFMHEVFHFFENITNPKYLQRVTTILNKYEKFGQPSELQAFYKNKIHTHTPLAAEDLDNFIRKMPSQKRIDTLQYYRYQLIREINAHKIGNRYEEKMTNFLAWKKGLNIEPNPIFPKEFYFYEKLKLIEKELAKAIRNERLKLRLRKNSMV